MKRCPGCGKENLDESVFCEECGMKLPEATGVRYAGEERRPAKKKSIVPVIAGGAAAVVALAAAILIIRTVGQKDAAKEADSAVLAQDDVVSDETLEEDAAEEETAGAEEETSGDTTPIPTIAPYEEESASADTVDGEATENTAGGDSTAQENTTESGDGAADAGGTQSVICQVVNCEESITLRAQPSVSAAEVCQIPLGAQVTFSGSIENGFCQITYDGKSGYGLASFLKTADGSDLVSSDAKPSMKVVNCDESITLRKTPSTKADEFCQIPLGAQVEFISTAENGFYLVAYNGYMGYALASYLTAC